MINETAFIWMPAILWAILKLGIRKVYDRCLATTFELNNAILSREKLKDRRGTKIYFIKEWGINGLLSLAIVLIIRQVFEFQKTIILPMIELEIPSFWYVLALFLAISVLSTIRYRYKKH